MLPLSWGSQALLDNTFFLNFRPNYIQRSSIHHLRPISKATLSTRMSFFFFKTVQLGFYCCHQAAWRQSPRCHVASALRSDSLSGRHWSGPCGPRHSSPVRDACPVTNYSIPGAESRVTQACALPQPRHTAPWAASQLHHSAPRFTRKRLHLTDANP